MKQILVIALLLLGFAVAQETSTDATATEARTIMDTLSAHPDFSTLYNAIVAAGLDSTLASDGPFTLLAPSNEAFAKLAPEDLEALLADPVELQAILLNHVVSGEYVAADVAAMDTITTMQMEGLSVAADDAGGVMIADAMVTATDIDASNGVIHMVDTVILPKVAAGLN